MISALEELPQRRRVQRPSWALLLLALAVAWGVFELAGSDTPLGRLFAAAVGIEPGVIPDPSSRLILAVAGALLAILIGGLSGLFQFRTQVAIVWAVLLGVFIAFAYNFDLKYSLIAEKFPYLAGIRLDPNGFILGAALTLYLSVISIACSTILGFLAGFGRMSRNAVAFGMATFYISFFRGTPLLLQIYLIYQGLAQQLNLVLGAITAGIIALSLNYGAYLAEINRAGIQSIPKGQREAAIALGLRPIVIMWKVILPQAMRVIIPPTFSQFIAMLKDTSLVSALGVWELLFLARSYGRADFRYIEMLLTAAALYWILSITLELVQVRIERYYGKGFAGDKAGTTPVHIPPGHH